MTPLLKSIHRLSNKRIQGKPIVITLAPTGSGDMIALRRLRERTQYIISLQEVYQMAALRYANKESAAKKQARKDGIPWKRAKASFVRANTIKT